MSISKFKIFQNKLDHLKIDDREIVRVMSGVGRSCLCGEHYLIFKAITVKNGVKKPYDLYMKKNLYENFDKQNILKIIRSKPNDSYLNEIILDDIFSQDDDFLFYDNCVF